MRRKILIFNLLFALALLPVAQAVSPAVAPAEHTHHGTMGMDCGQVDPAYCIDFDSCVAGSHASCDLNVKVNQVSLQPAYRPGGHAYVSDLAEGFLSHHPELLLRPPRIA